MTYEVKWHFLNIGLSAFIEGLAKFWDFAYITEGDGHLVFTAGDSMDKLLATFLEGRVIPLSSTEWLIMDAINWANEEVLVEQGENRRELAWHTIWCRTSIN